MTFVFTFSSHRTLHNFVEGFSGDDHIVGVLFCAERRDKVSISFRSEIFEGDIFHGCLDLGVPWGSRCLVIALAI